LRCRTSMDMIPLNLNQWESLRFSENLLNFPPLFSFSGVIWTETQIQWKFTEFQFIAPLKKISGGKFTKFPLNFRHSHCHSNLEWCIIAFAMLEYSEIGFCSLLLKTRTTSKWVTVPIGINSNINIAHRVLYTSRHSGTMYIVQPYKLLFRGSVNSHRHESLSTTSFRLNTVQGKSF